ncbi:MAG: redoxin domain-containing protein [Methanomassiliicoccales archaeon]
MNPLFKVKAPELHASFWLNSEPLTWKQLRGKVVMIDFMTYSCVNCVRTFPHMRYLWKELKDKHFMIIGVHTPEFSFEKEPRNIRDAIRRHGLEYPIAVDNDYEIWNAFGNRYWPAQYFVDHEGYIRHYRAGEGGEQEIEEWISLLLRRVGMKVEFGPRQHEEEIVLHDPVTPETYCGFLRNTGMGNPAECDAQGRCFYHDTDKVHQLGVIYLDGQWRQTEEYLEHEGKQRGHILLRYVAGEVNLVMTSQHESRIEVLLDGGPVPPNKRGEDIMEESGKTYVMLNRDDMFRIIKDKSGASVHTLTLVTSEPGVRFFAYTFGP